MWHFRFLGNLSAEEGGVSISLSPRKYTALLAYLVLHPARRWGRDELAAQFWPDSDDEAGRAALRTALSTLRKMLGADLFDTTRADTVGVRPEYFSADVAQFTAAIEKASRIPALPEQEVQLLNEASVLYTGPLLPGLYGDWAMIARERLEAAHEQAQNRLAVLQKRAAQDKERQAYEERLHRKADGPTLLFLPLYNSGFVGRTAELQQLSTLICGDMVVPPIRLITLTGPGGIGKTRVAVEAAKRLAFRFSGAVCFVPLAALTGGEEIGRALADALQIDRIPGTHPLQSSLFRLDDLGPSLLILDNMEQLVDAGAAPVVRTILAQLPQTIIIVTSRSLLGVEGEQEFPVSPLDAESCQQFFFQNARAACPNYGCSDLVTLHALCERLEGIPLAVELCAPWVRVLTEEQILDHLNNRFPLLTSRRRDVPTRHRSLHAALEWNCPTDPALLQFFASLSVFRGGFTLAAAEAVGGPNALTYLAALRDQSLVLADTPDKIPTMSLPGVMRYRMLETVREFAGEKLVGDEAAIVHRRALAYFKQLAFDLTPHLAGADSARYFAALDAESANFRASVEWGLDDTPKSLLLVYDLIKSLQWFWGIRGHRLPFAQWRHKTYVRRDELDESQRAYLTLDYAMYDAPENERESLLQETLQQFEVLGDRIGTTHTHEDLAFLYRRKERYAEMETAYRTAAELRRTSGDQRGYGYVLANLAGAFHQIGRIHEARILWNECREIALGFADTGSVAVLDRAAAVAFLDEGRIGEAMTLLQNAEVTFRHKGETWHLMDTLGHLGRALATAGQTEKAQVVWQEALLLARQCGDANRVQTISLLVS